MRGTARVERSGVVEIMANIRTHTKKKSGALTSKKEKGLGSIIHAAYGDLPLHQLRNNVEKANGIIPQYAEHPAAQQRKHT